MTWRQYGGNFDNPINPEFEQEARLVEQSRAGSERAFSALLARYQQPVFRLILYLVGDEEEARDLTRIAVKNALLHMPSVPTGFSIRPWLLRVAVLVALDAVRERSESPEALLASLQLPAPPRSPRIVDADPADSDTMILGVAQLESLADNPETTIADAWDTLPLDVERELIRRLLAGLPEGDAELLALGVVGQVPTRDLAALAGTSQRSVRRRIARALILFQSRYQGVRTEALPPAPETKELPSHTSATRTGPLVDAAKRGLTEANNLVRRGVQGIRTGFGSVDAQERLQTLRASNVPPAGVVPSAPNPAPEAYDAPPEREATMPPAAVYEELPTSPSALLAEPETTEPLSVVTAETWLDEEDATPGTFDPQSYANWTVPVPSMEMPDLGTTALPIVFAEEPITERLPVVTPEAPAETVPLATIAEVPVSAEVASQPELTQPAAPAAEMTTSIRPAAQEEAEMPATPPTATPSRALPRFGPPPEEVIVGTPPRDEPALPTAEESPITAEDFTIPAPVGSPVEATLVLDETESEPEAIAVQDEADRPTQDEMTVPSAEATASATTILLPPASMATEPTAPREMVTALESPPLVEMAMQPVVAADPTKEHLLAAVAAIERQGAESNDPPKKSGQGSTVIVQPMARADYVNRHRPAWLDTGDLGSIPGVALPTDEPPDAPETAAPSVPTLGALNMPVPVPEHADDTPDQNAPTTDAAWEDDAPPAMDMADLGDIAPVQKPDAVPSDEDETAADPSASLAAKRSQPPSRPMLKMERDIVDPPPER